MAAYCLQACSAQYKQAVQAKTVIAWVLSTLEINNYNKLEKSSYARKKICKKKNIPM